MKINEILVKIGEFIKAFAKKILEAIIEAKAENIVKAGIFVGTCIFSAAMFVKNVTRRHMEVKKQKNMSPVERALAIDFANHENRSKLDPLMKKLDKSFLGKEHKNFQKNSRNFKKKEKRNSYINEEDIEFLRQTNARPRSKEDIKAMRKMMAMKFPQYYDKDGNFHDSSLLDETRRFQNDYDAYLRLDATKTILGDNGFGLKELWDDPSFI